MVNPGKPSRGCRICKSRRIKCDEGKPTCKRCKMAGRECPGYQDPWEAVFHDERQSIEKKILKLKKTTSSATVIEVVKKQTQHQLTIQSLVAPKLYKQPVGPSLERTAIDCMLHTWSRVTPPKYVEGWLDLVVPVYVNSPEPSSIRHAFNALALCWFKRNERLHELARPAYKCYANAIRSTYMAIADPEQVKNDETLISILMLASFESLDCSDSHATGYRKHLEGAIRLVELRGTEQLERHTSLRLFRAVRLCLLTQRLVNSEKVSTEGGFDWFPKSEHYSNFINDITILGCRAADLRAECKQIFSSGHEIMSEDIKGLIATAETLHRDLKKWQAGKPAEFRHNTVILQEDNSKGTGIAKAWNGFTHIYSGVFEASVDGQYHTLRIYACAVIMRCHCWQIHKTDDVDFRTFGTMKEFRPIQESIDEICHIIPFSLGEIPAGATNLNKNPSELSEAAKRSMYSMITPLVTALGTEGVADRQRDWMKGRLTEMGEKLGLEICIGLAKTPPHIIFQKKNPYRSG